MALSCFVGSLTVPAATGNQAITGVGFQPSAVLFFGNRQASDAASSNGGSNAAMNHFVGVATSSTARGVVECNDDFSAGGLVSTPTATQCIRQRSSAGTLLFAADFVSMDADGFTVNFATANATAYVINFIALGGSDLTNVAVKSWTTPTATGNQSQTGVGFQPDALVFIGSETVRLIAGIPIGFISSTTQRGATANTYNTGPIIIPAHIKSVCAASRSNDHH
jgi:hypothetical protein